MQSNVAVLDFQRPFAAVGAGEHAALMALHLLGRSRPHSPVELLAERARAVQAHNSMVRPPWHVIRSRDPTHLLVLDSPEPTPVGFA